ncbi:hypothetical protein SK803_23525 [Lentzea sp. BCCO 10_0856]|uniref:Uncharacterized protein n=1 Tax=Lentzea miocenica TaxID=3095431 RepID=A0ABU4T4V7_9PSEU|nr:hypothetical protein [Lentzea sp. BCCO 10_0856]MDX8033199.1 hypothetical protein [Lentzea sp. BCCO 10_0856]
MTSMLPPTRDLPPGRHTQIRAELERAVSGRRRLSQLTVPILAAAAAVAVVAAGVVLLRPGPTEHVPAVHITTSPTSAPAVRDTFGLTPERIEAIEQGCATAENMSGKPTMYQFGREDAGPWALVYTDRAVVSCDLGRGGVEYYTFRPSEVFINWLPGHFSVDVVSSALGGDVTSSIPELAGAPGYRVVAGRVDSSVARITYRAEEGRTVEAKIVNGTYVARIAYPSNWGPGAQNVPMEVRAYDAAGNLLGTNAELAGTCYYAPDTKDVVHGEQGVSADRCKPATPWR